LFRREVGEVGFVELFNDETNKPRGCGIVEFEKIESVQVALDKMNRFDLNGRNLVVKEDYGNDRDKYEENLFFFILPKLFHFNLKSFPFLRYGRVIPKNPSGGGGGGGGNGNGGGGSNYRRDRDDDRM
jgi:RNA recognition motif-containing protein